MPQVPGCLPVEINGVARCEKGQLGGAAAMTVYFGVAPEVVPEAAGHDATLCDGFCFGWQVLADEGQQKGIMGAGQKDGVNFLGLSCQSVQVFFDKIIGARAAQFAIFDQWHPKRAGLLVYLQLWPKAVDFNGVGLGANGSLSAEDADVPRSGIVSDYFCCWSDNAEHPFMGGQSGQVELLDIAEGFGRGRVAGHHNEVASLCEKELYRF